jgi:hypothetical protein
MAFLRMSVSAAALLAFGTATSQAQSTHARVIIAPHGQPRIAGIAPAPAPQQSPTTTNGPTVFANYPIVITPDGQVLVDLGNGYQEVARACPYAYGYGCESYNQPSDSQPTVFQSYMPYLAPAYDSPRYAPRHEEPAHAPPPRPAAVYVKSGPVATPRGYAVPASAAPRRSVVHR